MAARHKANLRGAEVTANQLSDAASPHWATLPHGTRLSRDNRQAEFEEWRRKREATVVAKRAALDEWLKKERTKYDRDDDDDRDDWDGEDDD